MDDSERKKETLDDIKSLQSEIQRCKEKLESNETKLQTTEDEIAHRRRDLDEVKERIETHERVLKKDNFGGKKLEEESKKYHMETQVQQLLKERIPAMQDHQTESRDHELALEDKEKQVEEQKQGGGLHEYVVVSYVNQGRDDYKLSYRISKETTVQQLHLDSCAYWGCSHRDYGLYKPVDGDVPQPLWDIEADQESEKVKANKKLKLQDGKVLDPGEQAHLHLVRNSEALDWVEKLKEMKDQRQLPEVAKHNPDAHNSLKTFQPGLGICVNQRQSEPFVEALRPWPGLYHLLFNRKQAEQKWTRIALRDLCCFSFLILISGLVIGCRSASDPYALRNGVVQPLTGVDLEARAWDVTGFMAPDRKRLTDIRLHEELFDWLEGTFQQQVWDGNSTLRQHYTPIGFVRFWQQRALKRTCDRTNVPEQFIMPCHFIDVTHDEQYKGELPHASQDWSLFLNKSAGRSDYNGEDAIHWSEQPAAGLDGIPDQPLFGIVEPSYNGDGYSILYDFSEAAGNSFQQNLPFLKSSWVGTTSRFLAIEFLLKNYNMVGHVSTRLVFEFTPTGAVQPSMDIRPVKIFKTAEDETAEALDYVRWVLIIGYNSFIRVFFESRDKPGILYLRSFGCLADASIVAMFVAMQYMRLHRTPPAPSETEFQSYAYFAHIDEQLMICEALLIIGIIGRFVSFFAFKPGVFRIYRSMGRSLEMFFSFAFVIGPSLFGIAFLAHTLWSPYLFAFSDWKRVLLTTALACRRSFPDVLQMQEHQKVWTIIFLTFFFLSITVFLVNMFLAIAVHSYFETEIVDKVEKEKYAWKSEQWRDWALPAIISSKFRLDGEDSDDDDGGDDDGSSSSSDDEK